MSTQKPVVAKITCPVHTHERVEQFFADMWEGGTQPGGSQIEIGSGIDSHNNPVLVLGVKGLRQQVFTVEEAQNLAHAMEQGLVLGPKVMPPKGKYDSEAAQEIAAIFADVILAIRQSLMLIATEKTANMIHSSGNA